MRKILFKQISSVSLAILLTISGLGNAQQVSAKTLKTASFAYFDVGQGNSALIKSGSSSVLIDTGKKSEYSTLQRQLRQLNTSKIDTLVISHPDSDHMESADQIISSYHVKKIIFPKISATTQCYKKISRIVKVPDDVKILVLSYCENHGYHSGPVFFNKRGKPMQYHALYDMIRDAMQNAGLSYTMQDIRNASIAHMLHGMADPNDVAAYVGISERWLFRYRDVLNTLDKAPCDYQCFQLKYDHKENGNT